MRWEENKINVWVVSSTRKAVSISLRKLEYEKIGIFSAFQLLIELGKKEYLNTFNRQLYSILIIWKRWRRELCGYFDIH